MEMQLLKPWLQMQLLETSAVLQEGSTAVPWRSLTLPIAWGIRAGNVFQMGCIKCYDNFCKCSFARRRGKRQLH